MFSRIMYHKPRIGFGCNMIFDPSPLYFANDFWWRVEINIFWSEFYFRIRILWGLINLWPPLNVSAVFVGSYLTKFRHSSIEKPGGKWKISHDWLNVSIRIVVRSAQLLLPQPRLRGGQPLASGLLTGDKGFSLRPRREDGYQPQEQKLPPTFQKKPGCKLSLSSRESRATPQQSK